jgi:hypothetical protein
MEIAADKKPIAREVLAPYKSSLKIFAIGLDEIKKKRYNI